MTTVYTLREEKRDKYTFQKALIAYLEWKINEELQIVKKTRKMEISRIRPRNLNETADQLRVIRQVKPQSSNLCSPRFVEVFYTLDETYGQDTVIGMIRVVRFKNPEFPDITEVSRSLTSSPSPRPPSPIGPLPPSPQQAVRKPQPLSASGSARRSPHRLPDPSSAPSSLPQASNSSS